MKPVKKRRQLIACLQSRCILPAAHFVTRLADQLESKGFVYRMPGGHWNYLGVTKKGLLLLPALLESKKDFDDRCIELFGKTRVDKLAIFLNEATDKINSYNDN